MAFQRLCDPPAAAKRVGFDVVLPDPQDAPAVPAKQPGMPGIPLDIGDEFGSPPGAVSCRHRGVLGAAMPKAAVDENRNPLGREHEVGTDSAAIFPTSHHPNGNPAMAPPATHAKPSHGPCDHQFSRLVPGRADSPHQVGSFVRRQHIHHIVLSLWANHTVEGLANRANRLRFPNLKQCTLHAIQARRRNPEHKSSQPLLIRFAFESTPTQLLLERPLHSR